jgi:hypothetical protein
MDPEDTRRKPSAVLDLGYPLMLLYQTLNKDQEKMSVIPS